MDERFFVGKAVTSLQTMLRMIARCRDGLPSVIPDGIYGQQTVRAVKAFQRQAGLPATGTTDYETWNAVRAAFAAARVELEPAAPLELVMEPKAALTPGSDSRNVLLIQAMLHNLHEVYGNLGDCSMSGVMDEATCGAIRSLQKCCGMPQTGILDKALWMRLARLYTQAVGNGARKSDCQ